MIMNLSAGNNTSEEVAIILSNLKSEVTTLLADFKAEVMSAVSPVKSIQRGSLEPTGSGAPEVTVNINTVNPDKCMVLLNTSLIMGGDTAYTPALLELTATSFTVTWNGTWSDGRVFSWQVIEFY